MIGNLLSVMDCQVSVAVHLFPVNCHLFPRDKLIYEDQVNVHTFVSPRILFFFFFLIVPLVQRIFKAVSPDTKLKVKIMIIEMI